MSDMTEFETGESNQWRTIVKKIEAMRAIELAVLPLVVTTFLF